MLDNTDLFNKNDISLQTPLHLALMEDQCEIAQKLLANNKLEFSEGKGCLYNS